MDSIPNSTEKSNPSEKEKSSTRRHALPDTAPDTTDADKAKETAGKRYALPNGVDTHTKEQYNMREELYTAGNEFAKDVSYGDRSSFARSLANKTLDMVPGETRDITIYCPSKIYHFYADGYMHGYMIDALSVKEVQAQRKDRREAKHESNYGREITDLWSESVRFERGNAGERVPVSENRGATVDDDQVSRTARGGGS